MGASTNERSLLTRCRRDLLVAASLGFGCAASDPVGQADGTSAATTAGDASSGGHLECGEPAAVVEAIFDARCTVAGCHDAAAAAGLDLSVDDWSAQLVGRASTQCPGSIRVVPADPAASLLQHKVDGSTACGDPMPVGDPLAVTDVECITAWIEALDPSACPSCGAEACVDVTSSVEHCGACDSPCPAGIGCVQGRCACPADTIACANGCVDTTVDPANCGDCGVACEDAMVCNAGVCAAGCDELTACDGGCVDTDTHPLHCGGCESPCPGGEQCVAGTCSCAGEAPSYAAEVEPIFVAHCTAMGCHGSINPKEDLDLRQGSGYAALVGVASNQCANRLRVDPGNPQGSYLIDKLEGSDLCFGTQMPKSLPLSATQIELVSAWVCHGAQP